MATSSEVESIIQELPEVTEGIRFGNRTWFAGGKAFAWDRPFTTADIRRFGSTVPPEGPILAVRVADLAQRDAVLATSTSAIFTMAHFEGYPAVLIQLNAVSSAELREAILDAWLACAPSRLAESYMETRSSAKQ